MKDFDIDNLEKKNIYKKPVHLFEDIQNHVMARIEIENQQSQKEEVKIFKINWKWSYAVATVFVLAFGSIFIITNNQEQTQQITNNYGADTKTESQIAYEVLASDIDSVEGTVAPVTSTQTFAEKTPKKEKNNLIKSNLKANSKIEEQHINEFLDALSGSELTEMANNSTQDIYLDLYN